MADSEQFGFPLEGMEAAPRVIDQHAVRLELEAILAAAMADRSRAPWDIETHRRYRKSFPEKSKVLPPDEAEFLRRAFSNEMARIELLLAA